MEDFKVGLRCYDVHSGLRNVDPNSSTAAPLAETRVIGMAASLATTIRGQDVIADADSLRTIVAQELDISPYAFPTVIETLERAGVISVQRTGSRIASFTETVPFHQDLYAKLGQEWAEGKPSEIEQVIVAVVERLSASPMPAENIGDELGLDLNDVPRILELGEAAQLIKVVSTLDGDVLYSPFFGFENPELIGELFAAHGSGQLADELATLRQYQGLPISEAKYPALSDAVTRGLISAPTVQLPSLTDQSFATLPYLPDSTLLTTRKTVLEKALAVVACIRTAENFGGATSARSPVRVLNALLDPNRDYTLGAHSSHARQYQLLYRLQIVDFVPSGNWVRPKLIATMDNLEAVRLARDLLTYGEPIHDRGDSDAVSLLNLSAPYLSPIETVGRRRQRKTLNDREYRAVMDAAMGRTAL